MARINIEDCWWTDPRRSLLAKKVGSEEMADAIVIRAWRLAQQFWKDGKGLVPSELFETIPHSGDLVDSKLAEVRGGSVYVRGSSAYLDWVREQREVGRANGKKGGIASAKARKERTGSAIPSGASNEKPTKKTEAKPKQNRTVPNPSVSGSISVSDSGSSSSSSTGSVSATGQSLIANYCDRWKIRYGTYPTFQDKDAKNLKRFAESVGLARAKDLIGSFLLMNDSWFLTKRHDIPTFLNNLNAVTQFHDTGRKFTKSEIQDAEKTETNLSTLEKLRAGQI